ncbi:hypothetical protein BGZ99_002480 [Dissophora globulifera]|uniref:Uncharacterized protein n=1 Tax=Dissophora globulifera TaxID=979702 RepID=A0A9P6RSF3_9FUNG|nr:hypothetical protein BGZ99_002480 [Dissophora globulifera]
MFDGHLPAALSPTAPGTHSKNDFVTAWLSQQNIAASVSGDGEAFLDAKGYRMEHDSHHYHHYRLQQLQQQQHPPYELPSYKPDGDHQHAIIGNSGVQREPRQEQPRTSIQSLNQDYHYPSSSRQSPTMMPLQHNHQHQQQELQQYSPHQQHRSPSSLPYGHDQHYYHPPPQNHFHQQEHQQQQYLYQSYSHQGQQRQAQAHGHHQYRVSPSMDEHLHPGQSHRRSLSLTHGQRVEQNAFVPVPPKFEDLTPAEQVRQELLLRRQRYQLHHQHLQQNRQYQQQQQQQYHHFHRHENQHLRALASHSHYRQIEHYSHIAGAGMGATSHGLGRYPSTSSRHPPPKGRSAHELAWERHCYYQQQQLEEEAVAEQRRKEQRQEQHGEGLVSPALDPTARTKSLSRITSLSLSAETVESLGNGLSRSKSVSMLFGRGCSNSKQSQDVKKNRQLTTGPPMNSGAAVKAPMSAVDSSTLTVDHRLTTKRSEPLKPRLSGKHQERPALDVKSENADDNDVPEQLETLQPVASTSLPSKRDSSSSLVRRSTLKSIGPSIRSLARRCSSRFSNSSRPNSFAGSNSDPIIQFSASDKAIATGSLSAGTGNTALRHYTLEYEMINYSPPTSASTPILPTLTTPEPERVPIHRRVTLFRSKSLRVALASESSNDNDNNNTVTTSFPATPADATTTSTTTLGAMSLSSRPRDSLRLANGRGLNFTALQTKSLLDTAAATTTSTTPLDNSDIELSASTQDKASLATLIHASPSTSEEEQYEVTRRQIIALLASGRKERISVKTGQAMASSSSHHLSPLAIEAQENLLTPSPGEQKQADEEDPCERIAFMLVPKSRYEFQPLVMV